jgi:hypothetical protein
MRRVVADHMDYASADESVIGPRASAISMSWWADQADVILKVEATSVGGRTSEVMARLTGISNPNTPIGKLNRQHLQRLRGLDTQPYLSAGVLSGPSPGQVTALVDTGSALTIVSEEFCRVFGLPICAYTASFVTADGRQSGRIIGKVDFTL